MSASAPIPRVANERTSLRCNDLSGIPYVCERGGGSDGSLIDIEEFIGIEKHAAVCRETMFSDKTRRSGEIFLGGSAGISQQDGAGSLLTRFQAGFSGDSFGHALGHTQDKRVVQQGKRLGWSGRDRSPWCRSGRVGAVKRIQERISAGTQPGPINRTPVEWDADRVGHAIKLAVGDERRKVLVRRTSELAIELTSSGEHGVTQRFRL